MFGIFLAGLFMLFQVLLPEAGGTIAMFSLLAAGLTVYAAVVWSRTRLWIFTAGAIAGALGSASIVMIYASGCSLLTAPDAARWLVYSLMGLVPLSLLAASLFNRAEWAVWKQHLERMGPSDILLMRHIPRLVKRVSKPH